MDLKTWMGRNVPAFLLALQFMTRLPVPADHLFTPERMRETPRWYPAVGVVVGLIAALLFWGSAAVFPPVVAALISTLGGILVTGALHEDAFADVCDGLGGGRTRDRVLEIMRDSRLGSYGVLAIGLMVGGKIAVLAALPVWAVPAVLIAGHAASRASVVVVMATVEYARGDGAATGVAQGVDRTTLRFAAIWTGAAMIPLLFAVPFIAVLAGCVGLVGGHYAMRQRFERRLGGYTGDCLGAVQQCSEIGLYLGVLALI